MRMRRILIAVTALVVWGHVSLATGQVKRPPGSAPPRANPNPNARRPNKPNGKGSGNPAKELERFQKMSPDQRQKEMAKLPPAQRERMERQLERFEKMPPAQREQALKRLEALHKLSPQRRAAVTDELQNLRSMPPAERKTRLDSDEIKHNFSPDERKLLHESVGQQQIL